MKKIFLDTNFIADLFVERHDGTNHKEFAQILLAECKRQGYKFYITYLTIANFNYIARTQPKENRRNYLMMITNSFEVIPNTKEQILKALRIDAPDFEDALQYIAAKQAKCDFIITRDKKGFTISDIPIFSPQEFINQFLSSFQ